MKKGILFLGCSFTWGEGLYFYSGLDNLPFTETHHYEERKIRTVFHSYRKKYRFARLVADELDTWEWTSDVGNGGTNMTHYEYVVSESMAHGKIRFNDFRLFVWQLTEPVRDYPGSFEKLQISEKNTYSEEIKRQNLFINRICKRWESKGVKVLLLGWPSDYIRHPECPEEIKNRWIDIEFNGNTYPGLFELTENGEFKNSKGINEPPITVKDDFEPKGLQKNDTHLNLLGHRIVADSILKKLKKDNFTKENFNR